MLLFATDMVNICLIFGSILLFAILPKKKEGSDVDGWLLLRDTLYYIIGVVIFIAFVYFDMVAWWSGILMLLYWLIHLIILSYNEYIRDQVYLMVGLKHEDDSFNAEEQAKQVKRRNSLTELKCKNLIDKTDEQLKKKIMRMDALLRVKFAAGKHNNIKIRVELFRIFLLLLGQHIFYSFFPWIAARTQEEGNILTLVSSCVHDHLQYQEQAQAREASEEC